jgi:hypothetical protein
MKVYHGSDTYIDKIDLQKCKPGKDFGRGFYVTNIRAQAEEMSERVTRWSKKQAIVTEFEFNEYAWEDEDLKVLRFDKYNEEWLDFIVINRTKKKSDISHDYDIVEGPVADDKISRRVIRYINGKISKTDFLEELIHNKPTHQICFCTVKSLQMITLVDNIAANIEIEDISEAIIEMLVINEKITPDEAYDMYYNSDTYKKLEDHTTCFYKNRWQEIYEMLKQELFTE